MTSEATLLKREMAAGSEAASRSGRLAQGIVATPDLQGLVLNGRPEGFAGEGAGPAGLPDGRDEPAAGVAGGGGVAGVRLQAGPAGERGVEAGGEAGGDVRAGGFCPFRPSVQKRYRPPSRCAAGHFANSHA